MESGAPPVAICEEQIPSLTTDEKQDHCTADSPIDPQVEGVTNEVHLESEGPKFEGPDLTTQELQEEKLTEDQ